MKKAVFITLFLSLSFIVFSKNKNIDSLKILVKNIKDKTKK